MERLGYLCNWLSKRNHSYYKLPAGVNSYEQNSDDIHCVHQLSINEYEIQINTKVTVLSLGNSKSIDNEYSEYSKILG